MFFYLKEKHFLLCINMTDILNKVFTKRRALAQAILQVSSDATMLQISNKEVPKGDVYEFARAAGLLAIKKTSDVIPDCHPLPIEHAKITYETTDLQIKILVDVATIYKTGVEVEAMHGAAVTALTMYDMLKPIDKGIEIASIKLVEKSGGKSDFYDRLNRDLKTAVIVCSDTIFKEKKEDRAGKAVISLLEKYQLKNIYYTVIPDEKYDIQSQLTNLVQQQYDLLLFVGGTGLSPRDITPESVSELIEREIPGIMEAARQYGQQRTPYAMLSRGVAGYLSQTLVLTLPGSTKGAIETMEALFPALFHIFKVAEGSRHD
jgi:cyclic pyranopterin phosphate synthase